MAKATAVPKYVPPPIPKPRRIILELDLEEAEALSIVLRHVGGDPVTSKRQYVDRIYRALSGVGAGGPEGVTFGFVTPHSNITFRDFKDEEEQT